MPHATGGSLRCRAGIDVTPRFVNSATRVAVSRHGHALSFHTAHLKEDQSVLIDDLLTPTPEVVLLLSVCMWIAN